MLTTLKTAVELADFDSTAAQLSMVPSHRTLAPPPPDARQGAVMLLFYPYRDDLHLVFAKRPATMKNHPGQVAFPGGRHEPGETLAETALRETEEELGVAADEIQLVGKLRPIYIPPSNFFVHPFVGWRDRRPGFFPNPGEVAELIEVRLRHFQEKSNQAVELWPIQGRRWRIPFYKINGHKIWGGTATILAEMVARLSAVERQAHAE